MAAAQYRRKSKFVFCVRKAQYTLKLNRHREMPRLCSIILLNQESQMLGFILLYVLVDYTNQIYLVDSAAAQRFECHQEKEEENNDNSSAFVFHMI